MKTKKRLIGLGVALIFLVIICVFAAEVGQPAAKATAKIGNIAILESQDMNWTTILSNNIKTPTGKDLFIDVSLECGLYTQTEVRSKTGTRDTSTAEAGIQIRVLVDGDEALPGNVVFARRSQTVEAVFQGLIAGCLSVDPDTGNIILDEECVTPEELNLILSTMNANSFNFIMADLPSGIHNVQVQAKIVTATSSQAGTASATASIGKGSMTVETVRMIKGDLIELE